MRAYVLIMSLMTLSAAHGQAVDSGPKDASLEVFEGAKPKTLKPPAYPTGERMDATEGWVNVNFMIDPAGKPYEITIADSTGIPAFEKSALKAVKDWEFEPAMLNGVAIDSGRTMKVTFRITNPDTGASSDFVRAYRATFKAIEAEDRVAAEKAVAALKVTNLYEDAFYGLARYSYYQKWGDKRQQIAALSRALAHEGSAKFLPKPSFQSSLLAMMRLKYETRDFADLLSLWEIAQTAGIDESRISPWRPVIEDIVKLKTDGRSYAIDDEFGDATSWEYRLHKRKFHIAVTSGRIAEVKLRCEKKYVGFKFDPALQYTVNEKFGWCEMELIGDPATTFTLHQSN